METLTIEQVIERLGNLSVMELIALTKQLEQQWGIKAEPMLMQQAAPVVEQVIAKTEFAVVLISVPADKKMAVVKAVRDITGMGLIESKKMVESLPHLLKESIPEADALSIQAQLTAAGALCEVK